METWTSVEKKICACGNACGLLSDAPSAVLLLWWMVRHSVYGVIVYVLTISDVPAWVYQLLGAFWIVVHSYKAWYFINKKEEESVKDGEVAHKSLEMVVATQPSSDLDSAERGGRILDRDTARVLGRDAV